MIILNPKYGLRIVVCWSLKYGSVGEHQRALLASVRMPACCSKFPGAVRYIACPLKNSGILLMQP